PAGPANAPATESNAAPGKPAEPVARPATPRLYLSAAGSGPRHHAAMSSRSGSQAAGSPSGSDSPMSTMSTRPASGTAGPTARAGLRHPNVTVTPARTAGPTTAPVSTSTPDGTSTATTSGRGCSASSAATASAAGPRSPPRPPMPTMPSMTRSGAAS